MESEDNGHLQPYILHKTQIVSKSSCNKKAALEFQNKASKQNKSTFFHLCGHSTGSF